MHSTTPTTLQLWILQTNTELVAPTIPSSNEASSNRRPYHWHGKSSNSRKIAVSELAWTRRLGGRTESLSLEGRYRGWGGQSTENSANAQVAAKATASKVCHFVFTIASVSHKAQKDFQGRKSSLRLKQFFSGCTNQHCQPPAHC